MSDKNDDALDDLLGIVFSGQSPRAIERHIEFTTPSGRKFKYELSDYPVRPGITPEEAVTLAKRIFHDKYRYCEWDRKHPHVDVEKEIIAKILESIHRVAEALRRMEARKPKVFASWGIFVGDQLVEEFPYRERTKAERRLGELLAEKPGQYQLHQIRRTQKSQE